MLITGKPIPLIVLTPTINLMLDQTASLLERGIRALSLGSTQKDPTVVQRIKKGEINILFLTVERFFTSTEVHMYTCTCRFLNVATEGRIGLIAIDEAHLLCTWKSFRYGYINTVHV